MLTTREKMSRAMEWSQWSQSETARRAGVSRANLCDYLLGKSDLKTETADAIMRVLSKPGRQPVEREKPKRKNKRKAGGPVRADRVEGAEVQRPEDDVRAADEVSGVGGEPAGKSREAGPGGEEEGL